MLWTFVNFPPLFVNSFCGQWIIAFDTFDKYLRHVCFENISTSVL